MLLPFMTERNNFKCEICGYSCSRKADLKKHVASVHDGKKLFKCEICDYSCSKKSYLEKHVASDHDVKKTFK